MMERRGRRERGRERERVGVREEEGGEEKIEGKRKQKEEGRQGVKKMECTTSVFDDSPVQICTLPLNCREQGVTMKTDQDLEHSHGGSGIRWCLIQICFEYAIALTTHEGLPF